MPHINAVADGPVPKNPLLIEGFPGVGLVGKITADHLVTEFDMDHYANVHCEGIPPAAVYDEGTADLQTPVRLHVDADRGLVVLQSDVPVSPSAASNFADCIVDWYDEHGVTPVYLSGRPHEKSDEVPNIYGFATGEGRTFLDEAGIGYPDERGLVSGPTGTLLSHAIEHNRTAVGLVVESDPQFPDPEAARIIIKKGIEPLADIEVPVEDLVDHAEEIREAKEQLANRMQQSAEDSTRAQPLRMYQ